MDIVIQVRYCLTLNPDYKDFFMGLIRLIIIGLVVWMLWRLVNNFKARQNSKKQTGSNIEHQSMVLCQYCSVHVPEEDAIRHEQMWFCDEGHRAKYLDDNS